MEEMKTCISTANLTATISYASKYLQGSTTSEISLCSIEYVSNILMDQKVPWFGAEHREGKKKAQWYGGTYNRQTPQGLTGTWSQAKGGKGGSNGHCKRWNMQKCGAGCRYKWWGQVVGGCGWRLGGRWFAPGEEVGIVCKRKGIWRRTLVMEGRYSRRGKKRYRNIGWDRWVGRVRITCVISDGA